MKIEAMCETDVGLKRDKNQDSFLLDPDIGLYVVADGMGGHKGGEVASRLAVDTLQYTVKESFKRKDKKSAREIIQTAYIEASSMIYDKSNSESELRGMGTTLVTAFLYDSTFYIANVGDSRAYLLRGDYCWQITEDHSLIYEQIKAGLWSESNEEDFPARNVITRSVGFEKKVICDIFERKAEPGDRLLLCSDGLSGLVSDKKIAELINKSKTREALTNLINEAKKNGGDDNITAMIISVIN